MEKEEKFVEWARYPLPTYSNIIEEVGNKIFEYIFLNRDLETTLKECQQSAHKFLN
jgi:guanylate kinase